jgi:TRAP-type C4-dicarboxylate transport system substrate-binding protein
VKRLSILLFVSVIILLVISLVISCAPKPTPTPTPSPAPSPTPSPAPSPKEPVLLRLVVPAPPGDPLTVKDENLAARFNERAGGAYEIKVYPGETLVKIPEYLDGVRTGAIEMSDVAWGIYSGADPRLGVSEVPFLFDNIRASAAAQEALVELYDPIYQEKFNQKCLASLTTGEMDLCGTKPVKTLEDWKGLLVGAISPIISGMVEGLGGAPVPVMWTELYTNLEKGVIDAALQSNHGQIALKITDVAPYNTTFFSICGQNAYNINLDVWNAMPKNIQDILVEEVKVAAQEGNDMFIRWSAEDIETFKTLGVTVYMLPKAEQDRWKEACSPYSEKLLSDVGEFGLKIKQIADQANAENP